MKKINIFYLFILLSLQTSSEECKKNNTRFILNRKTITAVEEICLFQWEEKLMASSPSCRFPLLKRCPFKHIQKEKEWSSFITPNGSPGFNLCYSVGGIPQIYDIQSSGSWKVFERCFWKDTKDFVDIDQLIELYKNF